MFGFVAGLAVGIGLAFLFTPVSGRQLRSQITEKLDSSVREEAREIGARAGEKAYDELKQRLS